MHLLVPETHSLDAADAASDLGQTPGDLVLLSFADSDLGAAASAWQAAGEALPSLRLANIGKLRHPLSVDLYIDSVIVGARMVVARLLGGLDYWSYGVEELARVCEERGIALALLPGDNKVDPGLAALSTIDEAARARLGAYFGEGGPRNVGIALRLMAHLAGRGADPKGPPQAMPKHGLYSLGSGEIVGGTEGRPRALIVFYRAHLQAGDTGPIDALTAALEKKGLSPVGVYAASLKDPETGAFVEETLQEIGPSVILNATAFSARRKDGSSPLDAGGVPVLQVMLSGSSHEAWSLSARGLSQADLAMQVVLPELDGRLSSTAISFKGEEAPIPGLEFARTIHQTDEAGIQHAARQAAAWARLSAIDAKDRKIALVLSDYPSAGQAAHAIGLDAIESSVALLEFLREAGYSVGTDLPDGSAMASLLCEAEPKPYLRLADYDCLSKGLPAAALGKITAAWGDAQDDPAAATDAFHMRFCRFGNVVAAIQPDRGSPTERKAIYHDPDQPPRHAYAAFYVWLRDVERVDAIVHMGAHGTLEWLPGKAVAVSDDCFPTALSGGLPVIYPFIVNNPGEAAAAKRRLGAVTIGHLTPPLKSAGTHGAAAELERLIDEFAAADGLDARRTGILRGKILEGAESCGLLEECGVSRDMSEDDALSRLDAYLCDVKDLQIREGLHVFGRPPAENRRAALTEALATSHAQIDRAELEARLDRCAEREREALLAALDGRFVPPGPAGAPTRGRADVLPTGRNIFTIDSRAVPTRSAMVLAEKAAGELLRRHLQDHGDWPRSLLINLWGSATMRTGGEDLALALVLVGARPIWDDGSNRVNGFEITPVTLLERPRVDVTVRISGLFRDAFEAQITMFDRVVQAVALREEADELNPLAASSRGLTDEAFRRATTRIYGAAPGSYGAGVSDLLATGRWEERGELGESYIAASANAYGAGLDGRLDIDGFSNRIKDVDALVHQQDHREIDVLDSTDYAAHEGGFAAAAEELGAQPTLYHTDTSKPDAPKVRTLSEEINMVVRGRAANPVWIDGMMVHGYRGAAEISRALDGLFGFAAALPDRLDRQFELVFDATLGNEAVDQFLRNANPAARGAMVGRFNEAVDRDLWRPRRNSVAAILSEESS